MRPLRYTINVTVDGCVDHEAGAATEALHRFHAARIAEADALLFGRVTYQMMESAWRRGADGRWPEWMADWMVPFAQTIDRAKKFVVTSTLADVDWNAEVVDGDLATCVRAIKARPGARIATGGVALPLALAELGLIDEYEFVINPTIAGRGPSLLAGLRSRRDLELVAHEALDGGAVALLYRPAPT